MDYHLSFGRHFTYPHMIVDGNDLLVVMRATYAPGGDDRPPPLSPYGGYYKCALTLKPYPNHISNHLNPRLIPYPNPNPNPNPPPRLRPTNLGQASLLAKSFGLFSDDTPHHRGNVPTSVRGPSDGDALALAATTIPTPSRSTK